MNKFCVFLIITFILPFTAEAQETDLTRQYAQMIAEEEATLNKGWRRGVDACLPDATSRYSAQLTGAYYTGDAATLVGAILIAESCGNGALEGAAGERGAMQTMQIAYKDIVRINPDENYDLDLIVDSDSVKVGIIYFHLLKSHYGIEDIDLRIIAYNFGPDAKKHATTEKAQTYLAKVWYVLRRIDGKSFLSKPTFPLKLR